MGLDRLSLGVSEDELDDLLDELDSQGDLETSQQVLSIRTEKRRYDKPVTIIEGFDLSESEVESIASDLKSSVGAGGTVEEGRIEIQGDHRDRLPGLLRDRGFDVRE